MTDKFIRIGKATKQDNKGKAKLTHKVTKKYFD